MVKKFIILLYIVISLMIAVTACQSLPGFNLFSSGGQEADQAAPVSNFVDRRQNLQARVGEPLAIASYHRGYEKLARLEISVNGQQLRSEATAGQPNIFPEYLAAAQVLVRGRPAQASLQQLTYPVSACQYLAATGGPVQTSSVPLQPPSSVWTVCHIWLAQTPGIYELSIIAVDEDEHKGEPIVQQIEVR